MLELVIGFLLGIYFWYCWSHPRTRSVEPGLQSQLLLPHTEELELHHTSLSSNSQKVRACLAETRLQYKVIIHDLPSSGKWETKRADYLTNVNPAGTVPVLIHKGHPVYESHEQIKYIDQVLMPGGPKLTPLDPEKRKLMDKWVDSGSMITSEVIADPWAGMEKRAGNMLGPLTMPLFCANCLLYMDAWAMAVSIFMVPLVRDKFFVALFILFKMFGVKTFNKFKKLGDVIALGKKALYHHFTLLTQDLEASEGDYICGDQYTLADISLVPIFERMEVVRWWTEGLKEEFPLVLKYWQRIQERESYKASRADKYALEKAEKLGDQIDQWKREHTWFKAYYP